MKAHNEGQTTFLLVIWMCVMMHGVDAWASIQATDQKMLTVCESMKMGTEMGTSGIEGHDMTAQNLMPGPKRVSPFYLQVYGADDGKFRSGWQYSVGIMANQTISMNRYTGLLLHARELICKSNDTIKVKDELLGTFYIPGSYTLLQTIPCGGVPNSAVCHKTRQYKINETVTWTAPEQEVRVVFRATIVQDANVYWSEVYSSVLRHSYLPEAHPTCGAASLQTYLTLLLTLLALLAANN